MSNATPDPSIFVPDASVTATPAKFPPGMTLPPGLALRVKLPLDPDAEKFLRDAVDAQNYMLAIWRGHDDPGRTIDIHVYRAGFGMHRLRRALRMLDKQLTKWLIDAGVEKADVENEPPAKPRKVLQMPRITISKPIRKAAAKPAKKPAAKPEKTSKKPKKKAGK